MKFCGAAISALCLCAAALADLGPFKINNIDDLDVVECHNGPSQKYTTKLTYNLHEEVNLTCMMVGDDLWIRHKPYKALSQRNLALWGKTTDGCYVSAYHMDIDIEGPLIPLGECKERHDPPDYGAGPMFDDYYMKERCHEKIDPLGFTPCTCVSFVAARINDRLGVRFHSHYRGEQFMRADMWDHSGRLAGWRMNRTPKPGSIAQTNRWDDGKLHAPEPADPWSRQDGGEIGRVAWVAAVNGSLVTLEEYDFRWPQKYSWRRVDKTEFIRYLHPEV